MSNLINTEILELALEHWGRDIQIMIAIEEMAELTKAIIKYARNHDQKENLLNVQEEIADVFIMLEQLKICFGESEINEQIEYKMKRLEKRLDDSINE